MKFETAWLKDYVRAGEIDIKTGPFGTQLKAAEYQPVGTPVLNVKNLGYADIRNEKLDRVGKETTERLNIHLLMTGDIVFGRKGAVERHAYISENERGWLQGSDCIRLRVKTDSINSRFLSYFFLTSMHREFMISMCSHGTTMASLNQKILEQIVFPCPRRTIQDQIVSILEVIDNKIALNQKINDNLEQQAAAIFKSWFVELTPFGGEAPKAWTKVALDDLTTLVSRGIAPKYSDDAKQTVINQKCIRNHMIDLSLARTHIPKNINEKWLRFGDLLINSTGNGTLGRAAQVWFEPRNLTVDSHVTIVRPSKENLVFYIGLWGILHEKEIEALHTGSTGQTELPRDRVKAMELFLPDNDTLDRFNAVIAPMTASIVCNQEENQKLAALRDILLPKLISGGIDVSKVRI